jgi:hypothetical protein
MKYLKPPSYLTENSLRLYNKDKCKKCRLTKSGIYSYHCTLKGGYAVAQLVEPLCYKTEVAGSIPGDVTGIFH